MNKRDFKKIKKKIEKFESLLARLEIRPCEGDNDIKLKEIEIEDLKKQIHFLKYNQDEYLYGISLQHVINE